MAFSHECITWMVHIQRSWTNFMFLCFLAQQYIKIYRQQNIFGIHSEGMSVIMQTVGQLHTTLLRDGVE